MASNSTTTLFAFAAAMSIATSLTASPIAATFTLLQSPSFAERKPSNGYPTLGDWLIGTADDVTIGTVGNNPQGALSHNLVDIIGTGGAGFQLAPSLTGSLTLELSAATPNQWNVQVTQADYAGQAAPGMQMNQHLITLGSPAASDPHYLVDGLGNSGVWQNSTGVGGVIQFGMDFYLDPTFSAYPIDATFDNTLHEGYLLAVSSLTPAGLSGLALDDPAGYFAGDFEDYLLNVVGPLLPPDATYLLFTQMHKTNPVVAEPGLPITTASLIGNTTIAYSTATLPEPASLVLLALAGGVLSAVSRRRTS